MKKAVLFGTHKKCLKCGYSTTDLKAVTCGCGSFLYPVSQIYAPKTDYKEKK